MADEVTTLPGPGVETEARIDADPIRFMLADGKTEIVVPCPLTAETWWWIMGNCRVELDPNVEQDANAGFVQMLQGIIVRATRVLSVATGVKESELETAPELRSVLERLMAQVKGEWQDAAPFSSRNLLRGLELYRLERSLCGNPVSAAGNQPSQSKPKSAAGRGRKRAR